jgi:hypothetical protein
MYRAIDQCSHETGENERCDGVADESYQKPFTSPLAFDGDYFPCPPEKISGFLCVMKVFPPVGRGLSCVTGVVIHGGTSFIKLLKNKYLAVEGQDISKIQAKCEILKFL